jgi:hypothetical protein
LLAFSFLLSVILIITHRWTQFKIQNTDQPQQIRTLFAIILTTCFPSNPNDLWEKYKDYMCEDILQRLRVTTKNSRHSHLTCTMKHKFWLRTYVWQSLTKHRYNWECLRQIDPQTTFLIVICDGKHNLMSTNWVLKKIAFENLRKLFQIVTLSRYKLVTWSLVTWSLGHLVTWW